MLLLTALTDVPGFPGANERDYPHSVEACAAEWADALGAYAAGIVPPSTTVSLATEALEAALVAAFHSETAATAIDAAFATWAMNIGAGMLPTFVGVPPVAPLNIAGAFLTKPPTRAAGVAHLASYVDAWMRTGTANMIAPPFTVLPWS